jgi:hypothetical protein
MSQKRVVGFALGAVIAACAVIAQELPQRIAPPNRVRDPVIVPLRGEPIAISAVPREVRRAVVADAARRFKVAESSVVLASAEKLTWADSSLGCPEGGRVYAQMQEPGFRVLARTPQGDLRYHTDARGRLSVCVRSTQ